MVKATFAALQSVASPRSVANRRGKKVAELFGRPPIAVVGGVALAAVPDGAPGQEGAHNA
jgi:small subunit ribosomal protein S5